MLLPVSYSKRASQVTGVGYFIVTELCVIAKISGLCLYIQLQSSILVYNNLSGDNLVLDKGIFASLCNSC